MACSRIATARGEDRHDVILKIDRRELSGAFDLNSNVGGLPGVLDPNRRRSIGHRRDETGLVDGRHLRIHRRELRASSQVDVAPVFLRADDDLLSRVASGKAHLCRKNLEFGGELRRAERNQTGSCEKNRKLTHRSFHEDAGG